MEVLLFKTRLSIIACRHLVPNFYRGESVHVPAIAEVYGFSPRSISPAFSALVKAGILRSQVGGKYEERGFIFAKDPKEVSLYDIVAAVEGDFTFGCCSEILTCQPAKCDSCSIHNELERLIAMRRTMLSTTTIYGHYVSMLNHEK